MPHGPSPSPTKIGLAMSQIFGGRGLAKYIGRAALSRVSKRSRFVTLVSEQNQVPSSLSGGKRVCT
jgi:hypothetical protein